MINQKKTENQVNKFSHKSQKGSAIRETVYLERKEDMLKWGQKAGLFLESLI